MKVVRGGYILGVHMEPMFDDDSLSVRSDLTEVVEECRPFFTSRRNMTRTDLPQGESGEDLCEYKKSRIRRNALALERYHRWHNQYPFGDGSKKDSPT